MLTMTPRICTFYVGDVDFKIGVVGNTCYYIRFCVVNWCEVAMAHIIIGRRKEPIRLDRGLFAPDFGPDRSLPAPDVGPEQRRGFLLYADALALKMAAKEDARVREDGSNRPAIVGTLRPKTLDVATKSWRTWKGLSRQEKAYWIEKATPMTKFAKFIKPYERLWWRVNYNAELDQEKIVYPIPRPVMLELLSIEYHDRFLSKLLDRPTDANPKWFLAHVILTNGIWLLNMNGETERFDITIDEDRNKIPKDRHLYYALFDNDEDANQRIQWADEFVLLFMRNISKSKKKIFESAHLQRRELYYLKFDISNFDKSMKHPLDMWLPLTFIPKDERMKVLDSGPERVRLESSVGEKNNPSIKILGSGPFDFQDVLKNDRVLIYRDMTYRDTRLGLRTTGQKKPRESNPGY